MKKLIFILPLLYYSCTDDIISDIDSILTENAEQDAQIDSLMTVLTQQQAYIDSLNNAQNIADSLNNLTMQSYIDSLINAGNISDDLLQTYIDSLNNVQSNYDIDQQAYIDSLINLGNVSDSLIQVYTDSLNTVQNTLNANQQAYIDSLINLGNVSDSLLQVYTDSLNTVQNTYIDSLHSAQQTTLTALANSALNAGFVETVVLGASTVEDSWTDLDLSSVVGQKSSLVLLKVGLNDQGCGTCSNGIWFRPNGTSNEYHTEGTGYSNNQGLSMVSITNSSGQYHALTLINTDPQGIIEYQSLNTNSIFMSLVFYLN